MKSPISWIGSKRLLAPDIVEQLPEHRRYVEPFGGSLAVLLAKEPSPMEVVNDANEQLVNFYRVVRHHPDALLNTLEYIPNARSDFEAFLKRPGETDVIRAARWFVLNKLSFGAKGQDFATSPSGKGPSVASRANRLRAIERLNARLESVCVECMDWRGIFAKYDRPGTLFFVDPPYSNGQQYDEYPFSQDDHRALAETLKHMDGRFVLTYDAAPLIRELYSSWCTLKPVKQNKAIDESSGTLNQLLITHA